MAKNLFTFAGLNAKLFEELSWRKKELFLIKSGIPIVKNPLQTALLRSAVPILYSHWEGFVKLSMSYYLEYVSRKHLNHNELKNSFITLSLHNKLGDLGSSSFETKVKIVELIIDDFTKQANIPKKNIINTKSNLTFDVLQEILFILDLNDPTFDSKKELINDLVKTRNHIAHGEFQLVNYTTFISMYDDIIALMDSLKTKIENHAVMELYKR